MVKSLLWLRKGLRLHDNPALCAAIEGSSQLFPVFCLDPWFVKSGRVGANRMNFLLEVRAAQRACSPTKKANQLSQ